MAANMPLLDPMFADMNPSGLKAALAELAEGGVEERGAIFTRREVVEFVLDLVGYTCDQPLHHKRLLEPSVGVGDFLMPAIERLLQAYFGSKAKGKVEFEALTLAIRAVEIHRGSLTSIRVQLARVLLEAGFTAAEQSTLCNAWLIEGDFLLAVLPGSFDFVIGNPPYVRQELIPEALLVEYRRRFATLFDRADLYVPFIERSLSLLSYKGVLGFICADRWMKNRYGGPLRRMIADGYHLRYYVDMVDTPAFLTDVIAYPAITVIAKERGEYTRIAHRPEISSEVLSVLADRLQQLNTANSPDVQEISDVAKSDSPWVLSSSSDIALLKRIEKGFPSLEAANCKVGIGVATGADRIFIRPFESLDVESDRKLPLVMTRDISDGVVKWRGFGVINPFADDGSLVRLSDYPRLAAYFERYGEVIRSRHVSKKNPDTWYRTIDRITTSLAFQPKLLIPDIKGDAHIVYEDGKLYPHHNLYYVLSAEWDLKALRAVLLSSVAHLFISTYSTRMRGGYLRFQAQYLRRIRLPFWADLPESTRQALVAAGESGDVMACDEAAFCAYHLTDAERFALRRNKEAGLHDARTR